ncbi:MAG: thymidylate synthase [Methanobacteriota archaeon]|nr:MAG: thymidylate synthase [Euryarchaeota archaeon]
MLKHPEFYYLDLVKHTLMNGKKETRRNGKVLTHIGGALRFDLNDKVMPILTTKKLAWKSGLKELLWFISGDTNNTTLTNQGVKIWNKNASREFLDSRGLTMLCENDLGPIYGHQWRHFNAPYYTCNYNYNGLGVDQLNMIVNSLKDEKDRSSRRLIMSAWNPLQINKMALPPCHVLSQYHVTEENKLTCTVYQRSADLGLGLPFNIASYSFLTHLLAHHCNLEADELIMFIGNCHIYDDHVEALKEQLTRDPYLFPKLEIAELKEEIDDYKFSDFIIKDYKCHDKITMAMRE